MADQPSLFPDAQGLPARILDRRRWPAGVVPRHLQQWVLLGVALVMVAILALSGPPAIPRSVTPTNPATVAVDPNQQRIEDYQQRVQEQAQRLAAEQASLDAAKAAFSTAPPVLDAVRDPRGGRPSADIEAGVVPRPPAERETREERARFADNVAYSRQDERRSATIVPSSSTSDTMPAVPLPPGWPTVTLPPSPPPAVPAAPAAAPPVAAAPRPVEPAPIAVDATRPRYRLYEGTVIDAVLTNRLDATFTGPVNGLVSVPVYAAEHLVVPAGARVLGEAKAVNTFGQSRLAVTFHRLLMPNGTSVSLDHLPGMNQAGDLGLRDQVDRHYGQVFGVSVALGLLGGFAQAQTRVGVGATGVDLYGQGVAASVAQSSTRVLDRFLNLLPTVTIREGHRMKVYLSADLDLPAYPASSAPGGRP